MYEDELDWATLSGLPAGTQVFWREVSGMESEKSRPWAGEIIGVVSISDQEMVAVNVSARSRRQLATTRYFSKGTALRCGITLGVITAKADIDLRLASDVFGGFILGFKQSWLRSPRLECAVVCERAPFMADLEGIGTGTAGAFDSLASLLSLTSDTRGAHGKIKLVSARQEDKLNAECDLLILDGAAAARRLHEVTATNVLVLVDHTEYDEEIDQHVRTLMDHARNDVIPSPNGGFPELPAGFEVALFGLESGSSNERSVC